MSPHRTPPAAAGSEAEVQLVGAQVPGELFVVVHPHLADRDRVRVVVEHRADVAVDLVHAVVMLNLGSSSMSASSTSASVTSMSGQPGRFGHAVRDVDAEPVDAALEPEPQRLLEIVVDLAVLPVEVGLLGVEQVQIPLPGIAVRLGDPRPRGPPKIDTQLFGGCTPPGPGAVAEDVALPRVGAGPAASAAWNHGCAELVWLGTRSIVTLMPSAVGRLDQPVQRLHPAEQRVDVTRIRHIVAVVGHRRHHHRVQPDASTPNVSR